MYDGPFKDSEGTEIMVGDMVAYNYSGNTERGIVKETKKVALSFHDADCLARFPNSFSRCDIAIFNIQRSKLSRVKNSKGILVI